MLLTLDEVVKLKNDIAEKFKVQVHFHDGCGGQYFSLEEKNEALKLYIINYFENQNLVANFSENDLQFVVRKKQ